MPTLTDAFLGMLCRLLRHFDRGPIQYALETDWLAGAAGFEPLHRGMEIRFATAWLRHARVRAAAR